MQGQLLIGGTKPEDSPTFRTLLAKVGRITVLRGYAPNRALGGLTGANGECIVG